MDDSDSSEERTAGSGSHTKHATLGQHDKDHSNSVQNLIASVDRDGKFTVHAKASHESAPGNKNYRDDQSDSESDVDNEVLSRIDARPDESARGSRRPSWQMSQPTHVPVQARAGFLRSMINCLLCRTPSRPIRPNVEESQSQPDLPLSESKELAELVSDFQPVLPPLSSTDVMRKVKTLILDLDETLVHSSFKPVPNADFIIPVEIEHVIHQVYVCKRPGVDEFLEKVGPHYEVIIFTASLQKYADPVVDLLDRTRVVRGRLFREHCVNHYGNFVKDLSVLGRQLDRTIIIDNAPTSYIFHPENALPCMSWFDDPDDTELYEFIPVLIELSQAQDVRTDLKQIVKSRGVSNTPQYE